MDPYGFTIKVTQASVADEIAGASGLVSEKMYNYLRSLEEGLEDEDIYSDQDNMMRNHLDPLVRQAGLRKFTRR